MTEDVNTVTEVKSELWTETEEVVYTTTTTTTTWIMMMIKSTN